MLINLLKHEIKYMFKFLSIFYSLAIVFALATRLFFNIENSLIFNIIAQICSGATIAMIVNTIINNIIRFWVRFRQTIYGDESYLTHTLPVEKGTLYASKMLTGLITMFVSVIVIAISVFVAYYSEANMEILKTIFNTVGGALDVSVSALILVMALTLFLQYSCILQNGFTGIILGHKMQGGKIGFSFLFGFIVYSVSQTFGVLAIFIIGLFNKDIMEMFTSNNISSIDGLKTIFVVICIYYALVVAINFIVNVKLLKKGVNVE